MIKMLYEITFCRATGTRDELRGLGRSGTTGAHIKSMQTIQN